MVKYIESFEKFMRYLTTSIENMIELENIISYNLNVL